MVVLSLQFGQRMILFFYWHNSSPFISQAATSQAHVTCALRGSRRNDKIKCCSDSHPHLDVTR